MKKNILALATGFLLITQLLLPFKTFAACGTRLGESGRPCMGGSGTIENAITCPGTTSYCCSSVDECPEPQQNPEIPAGKNGGVCRNTSPVCDTGLACSAGANICTLESRARTPNTDQFCKDNTGINTAIGCIPITDQNALFGFFLRWGLGIAGGLAFLLIIFASFQIMTSSGDPKKMQAGKELLTAAISGVVLLIFSVFILRIIAGPSLLNIPFFN